MVKKSEFLFEDERKRNDGSQKFIHRRHRTVWIRDSRTRRRVQQRRTPKHIGRGGGL